MALFDQETFTKFFFDEKIGTEIDEHGNSVYDEALLKKVNAISLATHLPPLQGAREPRNPQRQRTHLNYKLLKCESRLVKLIFELNGLKQT